MEPPIRWEPGRAAGPPGAFPGSDTGLTRTWLGRQGWPAATFVVLFAALTALVVTGAAQPVDDRLVDVRPTG